MWPLEADFKTALNSPVCSVVQGHYAVLRVTPKIAEYDLRPKACCTLTA